MPNVTATARVLDPEAVPASQPAGDTVSVRTVIGEPTGFAALSQSLCECAPGRSEPRHDDDAETVMFVLAGQGLLHAGSEARPLEPESGVYIARGQEYALENPAPEPLRLVAVRVPDPAPGPPAIPRVRVRRLADQQAEAATSQREFRIVADPGTGLRSATQFVGYIPTVRAPDHFHTYDEVIYVLEGEGQLHAEGQAQRVQRGSCIQLPARTVHCLENTGAEQMRVVAVFRPAGSPAAAFYPDGTPAFAGTPAVGAS